MNRVNQSGTWVETPFSYFNYDDENRQSLVEIAASAGTSPLCTHLGGQACDSVQSFYDAQGTRVRRVLDKGSSEFTTLYVGPHYEKRPLGTSMQHLDGTTSLYLAFGRIVADRPYSYEGGSLERVNYYLADHLGSTSVVANSLLVTEWYQTYRPYGSDNVGVDYWGQPAPKDHDKFTGHVQDYNWLYDFNARSYLPGVGVFAQADSWEGDIANPDTMNPYSYVRGNPLNSIDPDGHVTWQVGKSWTPAQKGSEIDPNKPDSGLYHEDWEVCENCEGTDALHTSIYFLKAIEPYIHPSATAASFIWPESRAVIAVMAVDDLGRDDYKGAALDVTLGFVFRWMGNAHSPGSRGTGVLEEVAEDILPTPKVGSQKLQNIINDLYKGTTNPNRVGLGTTADAIRHKLATGEAVGGRFHTQKGAEYARALVKWLSDNPGAPNRDRVVAQSLLHDLRSALGGGP